MRTEPLVDASPGAILAALSRHQREAPATIARAVGGRVDDRPDMLLYVTGFQVSFTNGVKDARLRAATADRRIDEALTVLREAGVPALWSVDPLSRPEDLDRRLVRAGLHREEDMPWLAAELAGLDLDGSHPTGLVTRVVEDDQAHRQWLHAMVEGFGMSDLETTAIDRSARAVGSDPAGPWVRFVGTVDGEVVGSSGLMTFGGLAGIYNVATIPEARRQGIGAALTRAALRHAVELGYHVAALGASEIGRGVYERMGFREVCVVREYRLDPP